MNATFKVCYMVLATSAFSDTHNRVTLTVDVQEKNSGNYKPLETLMPVAQAANFCPGQLVMVTFEQMPK